MLFNLANKACVLATVTSYIYIQFYVRHNSWDSLHYNNSTDQMSCIHYGIVQFKIAYQSQKLIFELDLWSATFVAVVCKDICLYLRTADCCPSGWILIILRGAENANILRIKEYLGSESSYAACSRKITELIIC